MNEIDVLKKIASNLTERKNSAALSNYRVLCGNIEFLNKAFANAIGTLRGLHRQIESSLMDDSHLNPQYKSGTDLNAFVPIVSRLQLNSFSVFEKLAVLTGPDERAHITLESVSDLPGFPVHRSTDKGVSMLRIFVAMAVGLAASSVYAQTIERPAVKIGDECAFDVFDNLSKDNNGNPEKIAERRGVVKSVAEDRISIDWTQKILVTRDTEDLEEGTWIYDKDLNVIDRNGRKFDPPYPVRFYPLTPGAERKAVKTAFPRQQRDGDTTAQLDAKASNWESISGPAGRFDVITITWDGYYNTSVGLQRWSGRVYQQLSYSPSTSCMVAGTYRSYRSRGGIWSDRTYKLTSYKN